MKDRRIIVVLNNKIVYNEPVQTVGTYHKINGKVQVIDTMEKYADYEIKCLKSQAVGK